MKHSANPVPVGYHAVTPYLLVAGVPRLIAFLRHAFDAQEESRYTQPDGSVMHAELRIGDSVIMMAEAGKQWPAMPSALNLYVADADATYARALRAGATKVNEPTDQFYGDRCGGVKDPCGNIWWISTHVEDVPRQELERRQQERSL